MVKLGLPALIRVLDMTVGKKTTTQTTVNQEIPPQSPYLSPLPEATFSAQIKVAGLSQPNMNIVLKVNDKQIDNKKSDQDGKFTFDAVPLNQGNNHLSVTANTDKGTTSPAVTADIVFNNKAPQLTITDPKDEASLAGPDQKIVTIKGKVDDDSTLIRINNNFVPTGADGAFSFRTQLKEGVNEFNIVATDVAGNQTTHLLRVSYTL